MSRYSEISQFRKSFDVVTNWVHYPIATYLCALLSFTGISPNQITSLAIIFELSAIYFILTSFESNMILIVVLLQLGWIFDLMDGMLARFKKMGFYHPDNPSNKGYYLDAVSDHILKFMIIGALGYQLSRSHELGWEIGMLALIIHGITQTEHTLRGMINKQKNGNQDSGKVSDLTGQLALLMNNVYLFYLVFIPMNRIDILLISFAGFELLLLVKRTISFWINEP
ncbi:MAG: CDP-alcohol phosphatidyltransferase family protein [Candidatus Marinimicrobia bacterium]|jgi:phosphatidylglycerophosphate synthase|nr:CDP-alcohol phosphatidyltransferase family protein [Candidatus Neomarinimicrobiota bacterium]